MIRVIGLTAGVVALACATARAQHAGQRAVRVHGVPLPIHFYDAKTQLTDPAQIGVKRV
jgi:hypothetical protein